MQLSRLAFVIEAVPIKHAVRGVAVLLNLDQKIARADCVDASSGKKHRIAGLHANFLNAVFDCSLIQSTLELRSCYRFAQTKKEFCPRISSGHVPEFGLRFTAAFVCDFFRGMNLQRQFFLGVEKFHQQRKTLRVGRVPEDSLSILRPKFVQRLPAQRPIAHDTLCFGTIDYLP